MCVCVRSSEQVRAFAYTQKFTWIFFSKQKKNCHCVYHIMAKGGDRVLCEVHSENHVSFETYVLYAIFRYYSTLRTQFRVLFLYTLVILTLTHADTLAMPSLSPLPPRLWQCQSND